MFKSVKNKFIVLSIFFIIITVTIPIFFLVLQFRENFEQRSLVMLESTMDILHSGLNNSMLIGNHKNVHSIVRRISLNESVDHIRIFNKDGLILYSSDSIEVGKNLEFIAPSHVQLDSAYLQKRRISRISKEGVFRIIEPITNEPGCESCHGQQEFLGFVDVDTDLTRAETNFYTGSVHLAFLAIAVIIVMFIGSYFLFNYYINSPLKLFFHAIDNVEKGDLATRLPALKEDEFGVLQGHFNRMVARLQTSQDKIEELHFEQLQHADKLVTLGELTSEMAHEINNHAAIIMSRADFLKMESHSGQQIKKYKEDLDVIISQIGKVSKITGNILKHGKNVKKNFQNLDLVQIAGESLQILEPIFAKRNIAYVKELADTPINIWGDNLQIEQLITNLAINSLDAIERNGKIIISVKRNAEGQPTLTIQDNGKGISKAQLSQIYSPFYTTKPPDKGTGLGLYIVKNICINHNATISCSSKENEGTSFTITFNGE